MKGFLSYLFIAFLDTIGKLPYPREGEVYLDRDENPFSPIKSTVVVDAKKGYVLFYCIYKDGGTSIEQSISLGAFHILWRKEEA